MKDMRQQFWQQLGIRVPEDYLVYLQKHSKELAHDPFERKNWTVGLGGLDFVIGTTLAFRQRFPNFREENIIIAYLGYEEIPLIHEVKDVFAVLNTRTHEVFQIDSFNHGHKIADSFTDWADRWIAWIGDHDAMVAQHHGLWRVDWNHMQVHI